MGKGPEAGPNRSPKLPDGAAHIDAREAVPTPNPMEAFLDGYGLVDLRFKVAADKTAFHRAVLTHINKNTAFPVIFERLRAKRKAVYGELYEKVERAFENEVFNRYTLDVIGDDSNPFINGTKQARSNALAEINRRMSEDLRTAERARS